MAFLLVGPDSRVIRKAPPLVMQTTEELLYLLLCTVRDFHFLHVRQDGLFRGGAGASDTNVTAAR